MDSNYEECMCIELSLAKLRFRNQPQVPVFYKEQKLRTRFRPDIIVARKLSIEINGLPLLPTSQGGDAKIFITTYMVR